MAGFDYDLGIIGGGAAGLTAAAGSAQFGAKTILIEKSGKLGGDCLHYGCVPSKTLIHTASVWYNARRAKDFGLPALALPAVGLGRVMDHVQEVINRIQRHDSPERFCALGAEIRFGQPVFADDHAVELEGRKISAKNWIIATGSSPVVPSLEGLAAVPFWTNETVFSQRILPAHLIVLGGGPIGLEIAQAFSHLGAKVTIIEFMDQILGPEDADIAALLQTLLEAEGIKIHTQTKAVKAEMDGATIRLTIAPVNNDHSSQVIEGDALFLSTGRKPNVNNLALDKAGVNFTPQGILTNHRLKTNMAHIYACGDVNGQLPFTHVAGYEAGIALANAVLHLPRKVDYRKVGWCTYTDPEVASIGFNEKRAWKEGLQYTAFKESFNDNDRAQAEGKTSGMIKILVDRKGDLLGCQIIGHQAGELVHEWIIAMTGGVKLAKMAETVHIYPTLSEISKRVSGRVFSEKLFSEQTRKILRLFFNLKGRACNN